MALVVLNAHAGRTAPLAEPLQAWLRLHHPQVKLHRTVSVGEAQRVVAAAPAGSRVVVVGGDGSVHQLLLALLDGAHELALVSAGSGDDSARALALRGLPWQRAMNRALLAESVAADIGWVSTEHESRPFFSSLGVGFDAAVAQRALRGPPQLRGMARYLLATLREVAALRCQAVRVEVDDALLHEGPALFASTLNTATYGGGMPAVPQARVDDGELNLLLAGRFGRLGVLAMLPRLLMGWHLGHARVRCAPFHKLRIEATEPGAALPLAADGEAMQDARQVVVRVGAAKLRVVPGAAFKRSAPLREPSRESQREPLR